MKKIKVLYIIDKMDIGGAQRHILEILRLINRDLFEPHLCCLVRIGDLGGELNKLGIEPRVFNIKRIYGYSGISGTISLAKYIKQGQFDIVHTYLFLANLAGNVAAKLAAVPVIISARRDTGAPNEGGWHHNLAYRIAHNFANKVICVSNSVAGTVNHKEGVSKEKIAVIQNGIDFSGLDNYTGIKRQDIGLREDDFVVNMTGSFSWVKNHEFLLEAAPEIIKTNSRVKFLLIGDGELRKGIESKAKRLNLGSNIIFLGKRTDSLGLLRISDIALNLSFSEGSSNFILEAMALGKPVVATDIGGNRELALDNFLIPPGNSRILKDTIIDLSTRQGQLNGIIEAGKARVRDYFAFSDKLKELKGLYMSLLKRPSYKITGLNKSLRVLFLLTDEFRVAGAQINIMAVAKYLAGKGHTVFIACRRGGLNQEINCGNIKYIEIDFHFKGIKGLKSCVNNLKGIIDQYRPDIIAPQSIRTALLVYLAKKSFLSQTRPAVIATVYNIGSKFYSFFAAHLLNISSNYVIFESNYERNRLLRRSLNTAKSSVVYTGIDLEKFRPRDKDPLYAAKFGLYNGELIIGTIARLSSEKGISGLIKSLAIVKKHTDRFKLIVVGEGPLKNNLESMVDDLGLKEKVIFTGMQKDTDKFLSLFDIFVLPSMRESFSLAAREAMAMGKPVILTAVGGAGEMIENGKSGMLVPARNTQALAEAITLCISNRGLRQNMAEQARLRAEELFNKDKWLKDTENIYMEFANENT